MKKGFITIATGKDEYYELAKNLLSSYRRFSKNPLPFAIICDRENEITSLFDDVVILDKPTNSYLDKLELFNCKNVPYQEMIFIDADCLVYEDVNYLFDLYSSKTPVSCFGIRFDRENQDNGFFKMENLGKYTEVNTTNILHGGIYYVRREEDFLNRFYKLCLEINKDYYAYKFNFFPEPADEPIVSLAMEITNCEFCGSGERAYCFYFTAHKIWADMLNGKLKYQNYGYKGDASIYHFGHATTKLELYKEQVGVLNCVINSDYKSAKKLQKKSNKRERWKRFKFDIKLFFLKVRRKLKKRV